MFGDHLSVEQCEGLVAGLQGTRLWFSCAHGRPTMAPLADVVAVHKAVLWRTGLRPVRGVLGQVAAAGSVAAAPLGGLSAAKLRALLKATPRRG